MAKNKKTTDKSDNMKSVGYGYGYNERKDKEPKGRAMVYATKKFLEKLI